MKSYLLFILTTLLILPFPSQSCTVFKITKDGKTLIGSNEDWPKMNVIPKVWFVPASKDKYSVAYFGLDYQGDWAQCAINEKGLYYDGARLIPPAKFKIDPDNQKQIYDGDILREIMGKCANVEEAINLLNKFDFSRNDLLKNYFMFVDRSGKSIIIEYKHNQLIILGNDDPYQVMTNFKISAALKYPPPYPSCPRFRTATHELKNATILSKDFVKEVLDDVSQQGKVTTFISKIYALELGEINFYFPTEDNILFKYNIYDEFKRDFTFMISLFQKQG